MAQNIENINTLKNLPFYGEEIEGVKKKLCYEDICQVRVTCNTIIVARLKRACQILFKLPLIFHLKLAS